MSSEDKCSEESYHTGEEGDFADMADEDGGIYFIYLSL